MTATRHYHKPYVRTKQSIPMRDYVGSVLENYFGNLNHDRPENVYQMVLTEIEAPLLTAVMKYTSGNQSQAAQILGINRGTFRKKLAFYGML